MKRLAGLRFSDKSNNIIANHKINDIIFMTDYNNNIRYNVMYIGLGKEGRGGGGMEGRREES